MDVYAPGKWTTTVLFVWRAVQITSQPFINTAPGWNWAQFRNSPTSVREELSAFSKITWLLPTIRPLSICWRGGLGDTGNHQFQLFFFFLLLSCRSQNNVNFNVGICSTVWGWKRCLRSGDTSESKMVPTVSCNTPRQKSFLYLVVQPWLVGRVRLSDFAACLLFRGAARSRKRKQMASES